MIFGLLLEVVLCGYLIFDNLIRESYLDFLREELLILLNVGISFYSEINKFLTRQCLVTFYSKSTKLLNENYQLWIDLEGRIAWFPRSFDLIHLDFYLQGHIIENIQSRDQQRTYYVFESLKNENTLPSGLYIINILLTT